MQGAKKKVRSVSYAKWGYVFIAPFFIVFALFQLYPLVSTIYYSFFEYFFKQGGLIQVGPKFVGWTNYLYVFSKDLPRYFGNTIIMWLMGFIPQIVFSLLLAAWFTDNRLKLKCQGFFKTVIYMPNLIMASAFAMLFFALFADQGPVNNMIQALGGEPIRFLSNIWGTRSLVALMNFLMWLGNTTIILMAAMMGISPSMFEAAQIDGCTPFGILVRIILPLSIPVMCVIGLYYGVFLWNSYFQSLIYLTDKDKWPLQLFLRQILVANDVSAVDGGASPDEMARRAMRAETIKYAIVVLASVPMLIIYPFVQRYFVKGVMIGSVKG